MDYQDSMAGLEQIFQAILAQQMQPTEVEVDEMRMDGNGMVQSVESEEMRMKPTGQAGLDAMMSALQAAGTKNKDMPKVAYGYDARSQGW
jgi:hypothetical protein